MLELELRQRLWCNSEKQVAGHESPPIFPAYFQRAFSHEFGAYLVQ
ncbi:MAG: hypothetical protein JWL61_3401 [Gemmatimonadetes bacterium]|nr:hypothetical protein [Gemmatimonadota bacterium]